MRAQNTGGAIAAAATAAQQNTVFFSRENFTVPVVSCMFHDTHPGDPAGTIVKIKVLDIHPTGPWVLSCDEQHRVAIWDYKARRIVFEFSPQAEYARQQAAAALAAYVESQPNFVKTVEVGRARIRSLTRSRALEMGQEESKAPPKVSTGEVTKVRFCDAATLQWRTGCKPSRSTGSYNWALICFESYHVMVDYKTQQVLTLPATLGKASVVTVEPVYANWMALGCSDGTIHLWDYVRNEDILVLDAAWPKAVMHIESLRPETATPESTIQMVSATQDGRMFLWSLNVSESGRPISSAPKATLDPKAGAFQSLSVDHRGRKAVLLTTDRRVVLWNVKLDGITDRRNAPVTARVSCSDGERVTHAVLASYHRLPSQCLVSTGKVPVMDVVVPSWGPLEEEGRGTGGIGFPLCDVRELQPGLPSKLKVYALAQHQLQPGTWAIGTNTGLLVLQLDPQRTVATAVVSHPAWSSYWMNQHRIKSKEEEDEEIAAAKKAVLAAAAEGGSAEMPADEDAHHETKTNTTEQPDVCASDVISVFVEGGALRARVIEANFIDAGDMVGRQFSTCRTVSDIVLSPVAPATTAINIATGGMSRQLTGTGIRTKSGKPSGEQSAVTTAAWGPSELCVSGSGRYVSIVWPALRTYCIHAVGTAADGTLISREIASGNGVSVGWADAGPFAGTAFDRCIVMEPEYALPGAPPSNKKKGGPSPAAQHTIPPSALLYQVEGTVCTKALPEVPLPRAPHAIFGGVLAGVVLAEKDNEGNPAGRFQSDNMLELQFYEWEPVVPAAGGARGLNPVGNPLPAPIALQWDASHSRVAMCYPDRTHVLKVSVGAPVTGKKGNRRTSTLGARTGAGTVSSASATGEKQLQLQYMCVVPHAGAGPVYPFWHARALMLVAEAQVLIAFPHSRQPAGQTMGVSLTTVASHVPPPASQQSQDATTLAESFDPPALTAHVGGGSPLKVVNGRLMLAQLRPDLEAIAIPLNTPLIRLGVLVCSGHTEAALQWAQAMGPKVHDSAALFLSHFCPSMSILSLPGLTLPVALPLALSYGDVEFIRSLVGRGSAVIVSADSPFVPPRPSVHLPPAQHSAVQPWTFTFKVNRPPALHCVALFLSNRAEIAEGPELLRQLSTECVMSGRLADAAFIAAIGKAPAELLDALLAANRWSEAAALVMSSAGTTAEPPLLARTTLDNVLSGWNGYLEAQGLPVTVSK